MSIPLIPTARLWVFGIAVLVMVFGAVLTQFGYPSGLYPFQWVLLAGVAWQWVEPPPLHAEIAAYLRGAR